MPSAAAAANRPVVYLGLGANLGVRDHAIADVVTWLRSHGHIFATRISPLYETDAVADHPQPPYLNAVMRCQTTLDAPALLEACLAAESALGRTRPAGVRKAARAIDVDILLFGTSVIATATLHIPHPALLERPFVRIPLADVAEVGLLHPVTGAALDRALPHPGVRPWQAETRGSANPGQGVSDPRGRSSLAPVAPMAPFAAHDAARGGEMSEGHPGSGRLLIERRRAERIPLEMWVEESTEHERFFRRAGDLSRGGMGLDHTIPLPLGTVVHLTFTLPGGSQPLSVTGEIVSNGAPNELRMGVKFVDVVFECQARIDAYLAQASIDHAHG